MIVLSVLNILRVYVSAAVSKLLLHLLIYSYFFNFFFIFGNCHSYTKTDFTSSPRYLEDKLKGIRSFCNFPNLQETTSLFLTVPSRLLFLPEISL